ncbi:MAG TPA: SusC/RagA family TonB-linked outer membrane protein [Chryseosolibacter sp.]
MRLKKLLNTKYRYAGLLLVALSVTTPLAAQEKAAGDNKPVNDNKKLDINITVTDSEGNALPETWVVVNEGFTLAETDEKGVSSFKASPDDFVTLSHPGYEKTVALAAQLSANPNVVLQEAKLFMTADDVVPLPFMTLKKRQVTGSYDVIKGSTLESYPSTDIRNAFTGVGTGLEVQEMNGSPGMSAEEQLAVFGIGEKVNISSRGLDMMYIIDEVPTNITEMPLDPGEIESVTVVKDVVGKSMYGPAAANGIVFIKTRRGRENDRVLHANAEYGVNSIDRMPEWVSGADYARLNNIARTNSGLDPLYSDADIEAYAKNDPYDMYHPSVNYRDMILKNTMKFQRVNLSSSGGSDHVQYFSYLGYAGEGDIYKIGAPADYNRLNARSNIDIKVNDFVKVQFDFFGGLAFRKSPNYGYDPQFTSEGTDNPVLTITELPSLLSDITTTPPIAFPVYANNAPELESPWYAVSANYNTNPIGNVVKNGYYSETGRNGAFNVALEYDMSSFAKGLKSRTYVGYNGFNLVRIGKAENYTAYRATPSLTAAGADTILLTKVHDGVDQANQAKLHDFYFQRFAAYENLSYDKSFGQNSLQTSLTYYVSKVSRNGIEEPQRQMITTLAAAYSFNDKYNLQGVLNYTGSSSFSADARYFLSPTIGASWIASEEGFLKESGVIDYLKVRGEYGVLGYESFFSPFRYRDDWNNNNTGSQFGPYSSNQWFGSSTDNSVYRTSPSRTGNPDLTWEKRKEFNVGIDLLMANRKVFLEFNYYNELRDGMITLLSNLPLVAGTSSWLPVFNYNQARFSGIEAALSYAASKGNFTYSATGRVSMPKAVWEKYNEPNYRYDYQFHKGQDISAIRGQTYVGRFATDQEALEVPQLYDDVLHAGDLKYKDMNGDGVVDDNDASKIGNSLPKILYALEAHLGYKGFELTVVGTGRAMYDIVRNNRYYWNGWGDDTYSKFVADNVLNNGSDYPRLTYYKVNNNFVTSGYWLEKGGYFKIQNVELAWKLPESAMPWPGVHGIRVFARGANLYTFSKVKDVDPEAMSSGVYDYPLFRTVTTGVNLTF